MANRTYRDTLREEQRGISSNNSTRTQRHLRAHLATARQAAVHSEAAVNSRLNRARGCEVARAVRRTSSGECVAPPHRRPAVLCWLLSHCIRSFQFALATFCSLCPAFLYILLYVCYSRRLRHGERRVIRTHTPTWPLRDVYKRFVRIDSRRRARAAGSLIAGRLMTILNTDV